MVGNKTRGGRALIIAVGITVLVLLAGGAGAHSDGGGGSWQHYRDAAINNTGSALTDYKTLALSPAGAGMAQAETGFPSPLLMPGRLEANGTHFELNNSTYLNITLDSSEPVNLTLESAPEMVTMHIQPASGSASAQIRLGGFAPQTTYHMYKDDYHNHTVFTTDARGNYTYTQDISVSHLIFIQPRASTIFINDNATGGDCALIGTWDAATRTCKLTTDLTETIEIDSDGIILSGNGHTITGSYTGNGVYLSGRNEVTVKDLNIKGFYNGIFLYSSSNNMLRSNNNELNNGDGISLWSSSNNNTLNNNNVSKNDGGIYLYFSSRNTLNKNNLSNNGHYGIILSASNLNTLSNNNVLNNGRGYGIALAFDPGIPDSPSNNNTLSNNNVSNNNFTGIALFFSSNNILSNNIASNNNASGIILYDSSSNNTLSNNNALNNNYNGISLNFSSNSNTLIDNIASNNKNYGISLGDSSNNTLTGNNASNNNYGIYLRYSSNNNTIFNNYLNNTNNFYFSGSIYNNTWNTTKTASTNIIGGSYLGGNFWANPSGTGFSQICADSNGDGICDSPYILNADNIDHLPLSMNFTLDNTPPSSITNLRNISYASTYINWTWTDPMDADFTKVMVYINGNFKINVTKGKKYYNATSLIPNTSYRISTHTVDTSGNINKTWRNHTARTAPDRIPPRSVTNLTNRSYAPTYINWSWKDPSDADLSYVKVYIEGNFKTNVTKGKRFYNATGFLPNTSHKISTRTVDTSGNINSSWVNHSARTKKDSTKPASVTNLRNISYARNYINWTWTDPADADFKHVSVYIDGSYKTNVLKGKKFYNATGFLLNTSHKISTRTVDTSGNVNQTWRNHTARTAP